MATPKRACEITLEWLEMILSQYEAKANPGSSVQVTFFQVNPGTKPGENFGSEVVKVAVEGLVCRGHRSDSVTTHYSLFAKFLGGNSFEQAVGKLNKGPVRELLIYSDIIAELNEFQAEHGGDEYRIDIPEFVYGICSEDDYVLVMKDISPLGYATEDKRAGLDLPHVLMAADKLAKLHAVSYAFFRKHNFTQKYPDFVDVYDFSKVFYKVTSGIVYDGLIEAAEKKKEKYDYILTKLKSNKEAIMLKLITCFENHTQLTCLAHGDAWTNNFMYINSQVENGESHPQEMMLIDWGITMLRNPLLDLQYLIHTSTTLSLRKAHLEEILRHYHTIFTTATTSMGARVEKWELEDFMAEWRRTRIYGVFLGILTCMFALCEASKDISKKSTSSPSAFSTWFGSFMGKTFGPLLIYLLTSPTFEFMARWSFSSFIKGMVTELISWENSTLQNRVFDLLTEADEHGILDV